MNCLATWRRGLHPTSIPRMLGRCAAVSEDTPVHVFFCLADHFEPAWSGASQRVQQERVERWVRDYPSSIKGLQDSRGRPPQHTFFFPLEEYDPRLLDRLARLCHLGFGDVEVHLHHDHDTTERLREKLDWFRDELYYEHGLLAKSQQGQITYGFIHGNWALDNSRCDGRWCGVSDEITVLRDTGCYADFTMPSAPDPTQTRTVNSIYYAIDDPQRPKSHDRGIPAQVGAVPPPEGLLMIQGPLLFDWGNRKWGLLPRVENGALHAYAPPSERRLRLWMRARVRVTGRENWIFVKLHTHGAQEANTAILLGEAMRRFHMALAREAQQRGGFHYYYVTARQMADLVHQAEQGVRQPILSGKVYHVDSRTAVRGTVAQTERPTDDGCASSRQGAETASV